MGSIGPFTGRNRWCEQCRDWIDLGADPEGRAESKELHHRTHLSVGATIEDNPDLAALDAQLDEFYERFYGEGK